MLSEMVDTSNEKRNLKAAVISVFKCHKSGCDGYAFAPSMCCTICQESTPHTKSSIIPVTVNAHNGIPPCKQPRVSRQLFFPLLILSVGKAGIFDARHSPCHITSTSLSCHVKVEGCWCGIVMNPSDVQAVLFCEELQVLFLKPRDPLKQSLTSSLKLKAQCLLDKNSMKWIILVMGDRMEHSPEDNVTVQKMEVLASAVRENDGFCKMDCTLMEMRTLLLECGLRLPRAEARLQALAASGQSQAIQSSTQVSADFSDSKMSEQSQPKSEGGLLTNVLHSLSSAGMHFFGTRPCPVSHSNSTAITDSSTSCTAKNVEADNDDIIILSEESADQEPSKATQPLSDQTLSNRPRIDTSDSNVFKFDYQPPGSSENVTLTQAELDCLKPGGLLNDAIINFYLKYLYHEQLTELQRRATHLFNCFFYSRLVSTPTALNSAEPRPANSVQSSSVVSVASIKRHANVAKWTRRVDLFCKDYIVIPINEASHWFLGLVCYPWMAGMVSYTALYRAAAFDLCQLTDKYLDVDQITFPDSIDDWSLSEESIERRPSDPQGVAFDQWRRRRLAWLRQCGINAMPCVLLFDSLPCQTRVNNLHVIRDYLQVEWDTRRSEQDGPLLFNKDTIRGFSPRVPSQSNLVDCGIYLLHYVEMFLKQPVKSYTKDYFQNEMASWFSEDTICRKRSDIASLLNRLHSQSLQ